MFLLGFGTISDDFLNQALRIFVGFWAVMIAIALAFFAYVLLTVALRHRSRRK